MRHSVWLIPAALLLAGPVASALAQGCPGIVSRTYAQPQAATPSQTTSPIVYQGPITQPSQPTIVQGSDPAGQPMVIYQGAGSPSGPMMTGSDSYPAQPQARPGLFHRLFHRNAEPVMSNGPATGSMMESNVIVMPASGPVPSNLPAPMAQPMPSAPALGPASMNSDRTPQRSSSPGMMTQLLHRDAPAPANSNMPYIMTSSPSAGGAKYIVLPGASEMPQAMPAQPAARSMVMPVAMNQAEPTAVAAPVPVDFPIDAAFVPKVRFDSEYSCLTGQLYFVHSERAWIVRYAPPEIGDRNGGLVVLETSVDMKNFHEGDLVTVHGSLSSHKNGSSMINAPLYKAESVELVEHGEP